LTQVPAFHTDTVLDDYHPRERYVYHNQSDCGYGARIKRDDNDISGKGTDPDGNPRELCERCIDLALAPSKARGTGKHGA